MLNYNLPTEPSRHRVAVWRGLKKIGAVNIQQSMWVLAYNEENYSVMLKISQDVESNNGEALLMESVFFEDTHEARVISLFNHVRDEEYKEYISECKKYLREVEKEIMIEKFIFAELEEEEEELQKLVSWYNKIEARDAFHSSLRDAAKEITQEIKKAFKHYSELVYEHNDK